MKKTLMVLLFLGLFLVGCSDSPILACPTLPGSGKIYLSNNRPASYCSLMLTPVDFKGSGRPCWGQTKADGSFVLKTGNEEGVVPGVYRVAIKPVGTPGMSQEDLDQINEMIPLAYQSDELSTLVITVHCDTDLFLTIK